VAEEDGKGNMSPDKKAANKYGSKIDIMVAGIMALGRAIHNTEVEEVEYSGEILFG
jgi:phage terminase large subunit-like protein